MSFLKKILQRPADLKTRDRVSKRGLSASKRGFTLMELMVYVAVVGIVVLVAGQAFTDSTRFRVRTQNMIKATQEAENVAALFKSDVSQMGAKSSKENGITDGNDKFSDIYQKVYMINGSDSSSWEESWNDSEKNTSLFKFKKVRYNDSGIYQAVETITWELEDGTLSRSCTADSVVKDDGNCNNKVDMATNVATFRVIPAMPNSSKGTTDTTLTLLGPKFKLLPRYNDKEGAKTYEQAYVFSLSDSSVVLTAFKTNYDSENGGYSSGEKKVNQLFVVKDDASESNPSAWKSCREISLEKDTEYELSFEIPYPGNPQSDKVQMFVPGKDHMSVGFRTSEGTEISTIEDFLFYPPTNSESTGKRAMRFTVPEKIDKACIAFTFSFYSPIANEGKLTIDNLRLSKVATSNYDFSYFGGTYFDDVDGLDSGITEAKKLADSIKDKQNVKAFRVDLQIRRGGKKGDEKQKGERGSVSLVVPTPSNGPKD